RDRSTEDIVEEAEVLAKSCGIYLEFDRAKTGSDRDWMYMIRVTVPGGGPITREQWTIMDDIAEKYSTSDTYTGFSKPSLRLTTRQNVQIHWIKKRNLVDAVREIAKSGFYTLNGCGDNVRNVMGCPLSHISHNQYNANAWAQKAGKYFKLPSSAFIEIYEIDPTYMREAEERRPGEKFEYGENLLNRKFKIAFSTVHFDQEKGVYVPDNCVELRTNDIGIAPLVNGGDIERFQVYIGGSQGEKKGHPTFSALGQPLGIFREDQLLLGLDAIVKVHRDWGDRQNRQWARMKYVLYKMGIAWYRQQVRDISGIDFEEPITNLDYGARNLHQGWMKQSDGSWCYGAFLENGRIIDGPNGQLKTMVRYLIDNYPVNLLTTPNQDLLFSDVPPDEKERFEADLKKFGYGSRNGKPYSLLRSLSGACVGRDTCRLTYTDSEKFVPYLIDELETKWGDISESIGITGCERQCFRPATKTIGWVGSGLDQYQLKIGGSEDGRNLGAPVADPDTDETYLMYTPRKDVAIVTDALFEFYMNSRQLDEAKPGDMGYFFRRIGMKAIIRYLKENRGTFRLMAKPVKSQFTIKPTIPQ
ncbi:MAG: nitrite/sulfite reductase, partial [Candidatus Bathyarchaeia archaeon]